VSAVRYVVYLRVSTDQQADTGRGLEVQEQACRAWLRGKHRLTRIYTDAGRSGSADIGDRPGLAGALGELVDDRADALLVYRLDRLARDLVLQEQLLAQLHKLGKELRSCSPTEDANLLHDPDDPARALTRQILGSIAQYERSMIRLRLKAGKARKALEGGYIGGAPPYGYAAVRGQLVPLPDEQKALKLMCRLVDRGTSYRGVVAELERRGIPSRAPSRKWLPNTIWLIVNREKAKKQSAKNGATPSPELVGVSA
jgi:DNA invertase Pin-like site-specific DNA recombinase